MENSKKIIIANTSTINSVVDTLKSLLSEIVSMNEKCVGALENNETAETIKQHKLVNRSQCAIICVLNRTVIDLEGLLLEKPRAEIDDDFKLLKISSPTVARAEPTENYYEPEKALKREVGEEWPVQDIAETIARKFEEKTDESNDEISVNENVQFKKSGRRTTLKTGKTKGKKNACYEIRSRPLPLKFSQCMISHMESPSEFYIYDEEALHIEHISKVLSEVYTSSQSKYHSKTEMHEEFGLFCAAYVEKFNQWYRAELLDWFPEGEDDLVQIQLIDYGLCYLVPFFNLRPMLEEVSEYPKLAQRCHLHHLCPKGQETLRRQEYTWPTETIKAYLAALGNYMECSYEIVFVTECRDSIGIDLIKHGDEVSLSSHLYNIDAVSLTFVDEKQEDIKNCSFMMQQILESQGCLELPTMSEKEKLNRFFSTALPCERTEDINEAVGNYSPTDEKRICKYQDKCRKKNCKFEHVPFTKDYTTDRLPINLQPRSPLPLPKGGDTITLVITHIKSACNFYIHINPFDSNLLYRQFCEIDEIMNQSGTIKTYKPLKTLPAVGEIVLVKNWEGRWRRAEVQEVKTLDDIDTVDLQVFIVDYGEVSDVKLSDVREVEEEFLQVPFQAVECRLFNAGDNPNCDADEAREYVVFHTSGWYSAQVISANVGYLELLMGLNEKEDLGENLIRKGYAVPRTPSMVPAECELYLVD